MFRTSAKVLLGADAFCAILTTAVSGWIDRDVVVATRSKAGISLATAVAKQVREGFAIAPMTDSNMTPKARRSFNPYDRILFAPRKVRVR